MKNDFFTMLGAPNRAKTITGKTLMVPPWQEMAFFCRLPKVCFLGGEMYHLNKKNATARVFWYFDENDKCGYYLLLLEIGKCLTMFRCTMEPQIE